MCAGLGLLKQVFAFQQFLHHLVSGCYIHHCPHQCFLPIPVCHCRTRPQDFFFTVNNVPVFIVIWSVFGYRHAPVGIYSFFIVRMHIICNRMEVNIRCLVYLPELWSHFHLTCFHVQLKAAYLRLGLGIQQLFFTKQQFTGGIFFLVYVQYYARYFSSSSVFIPFENRCVVTHPYIGSRCIL